MVGWVNIAEKKQKAVGVSKVVGGKWKWDLLN